MQTLMNLMMYLLSSKKTLIYTTFKMDDYTKVVGQLKSAAVKYRAAATTEQSADTSGQPMRSYKIYVKKHDEHAALQAMYHG